MNNSCSSNMYIVNELTNINIRSPNMHICQLVNKYLYWSIKYRYLVSDYICAYIYTTKFVFCSPLPPRYMGLPPRTSITLGNSVKVREGSLGISLFLTTDNILQSYDISRLTSRHQPCEIIHTSQRRIWIVQRSAMPWCENTRVLLGKTRVF